MRVREVSQLFDVLDPSPYRERDLSHNAVEYIVESVREHPSKTAECMLVIYIENAVNPEEAKANLQHAIQIQFNRRSRVLRRELRDLMRRGLISLFIGLVFLGGIFIIGQLIQELLGEGAFTRLLTESLVIGGWVAMWRPLEIFLYDWWPILGERRLSDRLSRMDVEIVTGSPA